MLKSTYALLAAFAVLTSAVVAHANCGNCGDKAASAEKCAAGTCSSETCTATTCNAAQCDASKGCPIAAAMERLPKLTYSVGEKKTCCPKEAEALAKESSSHFHFCVGDKEFDTEADAQTALIEATEKFVAEFAEPKKCSVSGTLTLAGQTQSCEKTAAHTAELMKEAMSKVQLTYLVGEKECHCPIEARQASKDTGNATIFCVGEEKTGCEKTARLNLARAKYKAAVEAMIQAQASAAKPEPIAGT